MRWLKFATNRTPQILTGDSISRVQCEHNRTLPWDRTIASVNLEHKYQCYWEARYLERLNTSVEINESFEHYAWTWARMLEYGWIARRTLAGDALLDVGSGKSDFPAVLSSMVRSVLAIDILDYTDAHLEHMEELGAKYKWQRADARQLLFEDSTFDCVTCVSVLEHIPAPGDALAFREMVRVCKPRGRVLISVPYSHPQSIEDADHPSGLQRYYTFDDLAARFLSESLTLKDFNFAVCGMPEDRVPARFGHPEEASVAMLCFEKR